MERIKGINLLFFLCFLTMTGCERQLPLQNAIREGDVAKVKKIIAQNPRAINAKEIGEISYTPLIVAVDKRNEEIVQLLIEAGADINIKLTSGSALFYAVSRGDVKITKILLANGASLKKTKWNNFPLIIAAVEGRSYEIVKLLLEQGEDVNAEYIGGRGNNRDKILYTPLKMATKRGLVDIIELLISHGAEVNTKIENDDSALHEAVVSLYNSSQKAVEFLIENGADINAKGFHGKTPLHLASEGQPVLHYEKPHLLYYKPVDESIVEYLLKEGAEVNAMDDQGLTPLDYAVKNGHTKIIEILHKFGAKRNPSQEDKLGSAL